MQKGLRRSFAPDLGWGHNPGAHGPEIARIDARRATPVSWMPDYRMYGLVDARHLDRAPAPPKLPKASSRDDAIEEISRELGMGESGRIRVDTPFRTLEIRRSGAAHVASRRKDAREQLAKRIRPTAAQSNEVWLTLYAVSGGRGRRERPEIRTHYIKAWNDGGTFSVATEDHAGHVLITFFKAHEWEELDKRRRGILVYSSEGKAAK